LVGHDEVETLGLVICTYTPERTESPAPTAQRTPKPVEASRLRVVPSEGDPETRLA